MEPGRQQQVVARISDRFRPYRRRLIRPPVFPAKTAKNCARSFIKHIHYRPLAGSVSKTSTVECRSRFGIEPQYKLTQSKRLTAKSAWPKPGSKSTQLKKTFASKLNTRTRTRLSAAAKDATTIPRPLSIR